jgi:hypothetical protein
VIVGGLESLFRRLLLDSGTLQQLEVQPRLLYLVVQLDGSDLDLGGANLAAQVPQALGVPLFRPLAGELVPPAVDLLLECFDLSAQLEVELDALRCRQ